jgi:hypothetical protein
MLSGSTVRNIEAVVVLVGAFAASIFIPHETLMPIAVAVLAASVGCVFAIRARMQRLDPKEFGPQREFLLEIGVVVAMAGLAAFIVLLIEFAD